MDESHNDQRLCPDQGLLADLVLGKLANDAIDGVARHVEHCGACQAVLESLDTLEDSFVNGLRQDAPFEPAEIDAELEQQLLAAEAISQVAWSASSVAEPDDKLLPRHLGQYLLLEKIGQGGMGVVYKARHEKLKRLVAVKLLPPERLTNADALQRFHREMEMVASLDHPNAVRAHDANEVDGQHFLVMEFVDGVNLAQLVRRHGTLSVVDACQIVRQAAMGLQAAHERGLIHRDIKPSNIILGRDGQVKLLDLGLALLHTESTPGSDMTASNQVVGTANYMAPEQGLDARAADARSDLYSLGCTFYFLLTGKPPFAGHGDTPMQKVLAHAQEAVPCISLVRGDVPDALIRLLVSMLAKRPEDRPATAGAVAEAVQAFCDGADLQAAITGQVRSASDRPKKPSSLGWVATSVLVGLVIFAVTNVWQPGSEPGSGGKASTLDSPAAATVRGERPAQDSTPNQKTSEGGQLSERAPTPMLHTNPEPKRRPRPSSWALGKDPRMRLTGTGAGIWQPERSDRFHTWQVIGPFVHDTTDAAFDAVHPIEQDWVALGGKFETAAGKRTWHPLEVYSPTTNLAKLTGASVPAGKAGVYYAVCWAKFPSGTRALAWELFTPCRSKFWVNGRLVQARKKSGVSKGDGLQRILDEGWNELLLKCVVPAQRSEDFYPYFDFQVIRGLNPSGRPDDELLPHSMNEPPE